MRGRGGCGVARGEDGDPRAAGTQDDFPFIDALQKANKDALGFQFEAAIRGHIGKGNVLVAEAASNDQGPMRNGQGEGSVGHSSFRLGHSHAVGYCMGVDRYHKRDDVGIIYQMGVLPEYRRSLVAAHLLKARFGASAYGRRLYCCWCAQDLTGAGAFWEAMGFVPLAYRTGSQMKTFVVDGVKVRRPRIYIFWQKRVRVGDEGLGATPWWYPSETGGGAIGANRIVLPIRPGERWEDAKPVVLPRELVALPAPAEAEEEGGTAKSRRREGRKKIGKEKKVEGPAAPGAGAGLGGFAVGFGASPGEVEQKEAEREAVKEAARAQKRRKRELLKANDPALCEFSRELRDRWSEALAASPGLIEAAATARYAVGRLIEGSGPPGVRVVEAVTRPGAKRFAG